MKHPTKWIAAAVAVAGGLTLANSARAQAVTGDVNLDNIAPGAVTAYYANWASQPFPTTVSDGAAGFQIGSLGYGSLYYAIPAGQQQVLNKNDNEATLVMTVNNAVSPASQNYWLGVPFVLDDNAESQTYGGYLGMFGYVNTTSGTGGTATWSGNTVTETVPLDALQTATIAAGGDLINGFNLELDPAVLPAGPPFYNVTFDSLTLSGPAAAPDETSTLALMGPAAAALLAFRRRNK
jgi:hypothetical protein